MKRNAPLRTARPGPLYPNAADERYFAARALELLAAIASGSAAITAMLFLVTMA